MWGNKKIKSHVASLVKKEAENVRKKQVKVEKVLKEVAAWVSEVAGTASPATDPKILKADGNQSKAMTEALKLKAILKRRNQKP